MPHTIYTFTLHRLGVVLVAIGALIVAGLLFTAGWLVGTRRPQPATKTTAEALAEPAAAPKGSALAPPAPAASPAAPQAPGEAAAAAPAPAGSKLLPAVTFALEIGTFVTDAQAQELAAELQQRGFEPVVVEQKAPRGHSLFRVMVGSYTSRAEATKAAEAFVREEDRRAVVVEARLPKPGNGAP